MASIHLHISEIRIFWFSTEFWKIVDELMECTIYTCWIQFSQNYGKTAFHQFISGIRNPESGFTNFRDFRDFPISIEMQIDGMGSTVSANRVKNISLEFDLPLVDEFTLSEQKLNPNLPMMWKLREKIVASFR